MRVMVSPFVCPRLQLALTLHWLALLTVRAVDLAFACLLGLRSL